MNYLPRHAMGMARKRAHDKSTCSTRLLCRSRPVHLIRLLWWQCRGSNLRFKTQRVFCWRFKHLVHSLCTSTSSLVWSVNWFFHSVLVFCPNNRPSYKYKQRVRLGTYLLMFVASHWLKLVSALSKCVHIDLLYFRGEQWCPLTMGNDEDMPSYRSSGQTENSLKCREAYRTQRTTVV
jgi:hypothetical protein